MRSRFASRLLEPLPFLGLIVFFIGFGASSFALVVDLIEERRSPYQGLLTFGLYPTVMALGAFLVLLGLFLSRRRERRALAAKPSDERALASAHRHRRILLALSAFGFVLVLLSIVGAFRAYEYTESEEFCGALCHDPMEAQFAAYHDSPHARIACVECHVGPGPQGYLEAKLSGLRQVWEVATSTIPRPIRAHRDKLPSAAESCEHCHESERQIGISLIDRTRFSYDPRSSELFLRVALDVGGVGKNASETRGIHWHADPRNRVWFKARDPRELDIAWVRVERSDGTTREYRRREDPVTAQRIASVASPTARANVAREDGPVESLETQLMDCIDCHNRVAHRFDTAERSVDDALAAGRIDRSLPWIKRFGVIVSAHDWPSREAASEGVASLLRERYEEHLPTVARDRAATISEAATVLAQHWARNHFPAYSIDGRTYPDHSSHKRFPGCFRCHDGNMVSDTGETIPSDCSLCHDFFHRDPASGSLVAIGADASALHPFSDPAHVAIGCSTCHDDRALPTSACAGCHKDAGEGHILRDDCSVCHRAGEPKVTVNTCAPCHPMGGSPLHAAAGHEDCLACHRPHAWKEIDRSGSSCIGCHETIQGMPAREHRPGHEGCLGECHSFSGAAAQVAGLAIKGR